MSSLDWLAVGGATRGTPGRCRHRPWRCLAFGFLACAAIMQTGCQSGPLASCGGCGGGSGSGLFSPCGFFGRVTSRVMNRGSNGCCGSGAVTDGTVEYAAPAAAGGATIVPSSPSGTTVGTPSYVSPGTGDPGDLSPASDPTPKTKVVPNTYGKSGSNSGSTTSSTGYVTRRYDSGSRIARRRIDGLPKTTITTAEPTSRSASAVARPSGGDTNVSPEDNALDHLPPLDLPGEVTRSSAPPAAAAAAGQAAKPAESQKESDVRTEPPPPAAGELGPAAAPAPAPEPSSLSTVAPGVARFASVDLKLAGGSAPSPAGLDWLAEKGYRTVLDLRQSSEVPPWFIAEVTNRGLRYVALPIGIDSLDRDHVARFNYELAASEARPLFFFDADGGRAGALWYIRRIANDHVDHQIARREAEELGLKDPGYWSAATRYVASLDPAQASATPDRRPASVMAGPSAARDASTDSSQPANVPAGLPTASQPAAAGAEPPPPPSPVAQFQQPAVPSAAPADLSAWRPFAAMVVTGLTLPLAYWTSSLGSTALAKARASLPAPAHRRKALPRESGA